MTFDPFGDYDTCGYLRNVFHEKDLNIVKDLENSSFILNIDDAVLGLSNKPINYEAFKLTHKRLFAELYPWAGQDRAKTAPNIAITRGDHDKLFCHPADVRRSADYALRNIESAEFSAGDCFADLAHAHPFLDGNGRTILTLHSEIMRRKGQHVEWERTIKEEFLAALTVDLENPGNGAFAAYINPYIRNNSLTLEEIGAKLKTFMG